LAFDKAAKAMDQLTFLLLEGRGKSEVEVEGNPLALRVKLELAERKGRKSKQHREGRQKKAKNGLGSQ